jgi:4-hydroxybenzoate polyprenyltransferase
MVVCVRSTDFIGYFVVCVVLAVASCPIIVVRSLVTVFVCVVMAVASCPNIFVHHIITVFVLGIVAGLILIFGIVAGIILTALLFLFTAS